MARWGGSAWGGDALLAQQQGAHVFKISPSTLVTVQALSEGTWLRDGTTAGSSGRQRKVIRSCRLAMPTGFLMTLEQDTWWLCSSHQVEGVSVGVASWWRLSCVGVVWSVVKPREALVTR